jgi:acyl-CoA synthetase (NDP forming)
LRPRSVAIVGVSPEPGSIGANVLDNLTGIGFSGDIHLVSRTNREIGGRRCFGSIDELPEGVDVAVLAVPRQATVDAVKACVRRNIGAALVFASGFAEIDETGSAEQATMASIANEGSLALCGPNCIGFANLTDRVALTFEPLALPPPYPPPHAGEGRVGGGRARAIGVVTQSGAMCSTLRLALLAKELNLSCVVSTGNEAQLTTEDFLAFLIEDDATQVVVLFMEQVRDPGLFLALCARARTRKKPIVLMHPGRSARAQASARTHTGAMADNHAVMAALVTHETVVLVETLEELIDTAEILARFPKPPVKGAAVMTNSGAFKGYALDFAETIGLDLPVLSAVSVAGIKAVLPPFAAIENPVDVTAHSMRDATILSRTAAHLLADPAMGSLVISIVAGAPRFAMAKANAIGAGIANLEKPIAVATMGDDTPLPAEFPTLLRDHGLAFFRSPERALRAMARATWYGREVTSARRRAPPVSLQAPLPNPPPHAGEEISMNPPPHAGEEISMNPPPHAGEGREGASGAVAEYVGKKLLSLLGIAVPAGELARDPSAARDIARRIGFPVVLKAQSDALAHKSDVGGVILDIADETALTRAWDRIAANIHKARGDLVLDGMLVETMAAPGLELVVGAHREKAWGPFVTIGIGGIWIEALRDIRLLPADLDHDGIIEELLKLKGAALLRGHRGAPDADLDAIAECVLRLGALVRGDPRVTEVEINPLVAYPKGALALDVLMHVEEPQAHIPSP